MTAHVSDAAQLALVLRYVTDTGVEELQMMYVVVTAVNGHSLNCVNWVSCFSKGVHSRYSRHLSAMQCSVTLCFCTILIVSIAVAS